MAGFSATDAALEGFRITREKPRAFMAWTAFSFAVSVLGVFITFAMPEEARRALESLSSDQPAEPEALLSALTLLSPLLLFGLIVQCVMAAAVYRIMLHPEEARFSYLRLGRDELRLMALTLIYLVLFVLLLAVVQVGVLLIALAASALGQGAMMFVMTALTLFSLGICLFIGVRMSLAPAITFDTQRLAILDSWPMTRGHFWRLLGAYILAVACLFVVAVVAMVLFLSVAAIILVATGGGIGDVGQVIQPDETSLRSYLNPFVLAYMLLGSLFQALWYAVVAAPGAYAYRALREQKRAFE